MPYKDGYAHDCGDSDIFTSLAALLAEEERGEFAAWLAEHPEAGDVVRKSGGVRKIRWTRAGSGKSGGVRVIYFNRLTNGEIWLVFMYAKAELDTITGEVLREMKDEIEKTID